MKNAGPQARVFHLVASLTDIFHKPFSVGERGLETYSFSIPFGYFSVDKISQKVFESHETVPQTVS